MAIKVPFLVRIENLRRGVRAAYCWLEQGTTCAVWERVVALDVPEGWPRIERALPEERGILRGFVGEKSWN